jgi:hypothetical protein
MADSYNGFAFTFDRKFGGKPINPIIVIHPGINVRVGRRPGRQLLVVAKDLRRATEIAREMIWYANFVEAGPEVLARARKLGIRNNGAGIDDGPAS